MAACRTSRLTYTAVCHTACLHCAPQDEPDHQRELYASILNQLLMNFLMCTAGK